MTGSMIREKVPLAIELVERCAYELLPVIVRPGVGDDHDDPRTVHDDIVDHRTSRTVTSRRGRKFL